MAEAGGVDVHLAVMINYVYEFDSFCTSIIAKLQNGTIIHERNLDFYFPNSTRNITYIAKFYRGDRYLFDSVMFAGIIGVYTGQKEGAFSVTLNQRENNLSLWGLAENIKLMFTGYIQASWSIRETLTQCHNYDCAVSKLSTQNHIAPSYILIAGVKDN
jgi:hypothetical protein